jgi:hypothetical protein
MDLLTILVVVLVILWLGGYFAFHVTSGLIHLLLVVAAVVLVHPPLAGQDGPPDSPELRHARGRALEPAFRKHSPEAPPGPVAR